jgi:hypothetical protein
MKECTKVIMIMSITLFSAGIINMVIIDVANAEIKPHVNSQENQLNGQNGQLNRPQNQLGNMQNKQQIKDKEYKDSKGMDKINGLNMNNLDDMSNLENLDNQSNDINVIKRKVELERLKADLKKSQNSTLGVSASNGFMPQTVATGIIIDARGKKIATLNFADGSDLDVEIGNRVDDYYVTDITVNGVVLTKYKLTSSGKSNMNYANSNYINSKGAKSYKGHSILIKRSYPKMANIMSGGNSRFTSQQNMQGSGVQGSSTNPFMPTPTITDANMDNTISSPFSLHESENNYVPPIVAE